MQFKAPLVWTTLEVLMHADGRSEFSMSGASPFPRHWIYDDEGKLSAKAGLADFKDWYRNAFGKHTPWGDEDSPALVTAVETALERDLATTIMRGGEKPTVRKVKEGHVLVEQGQLGSELYLLLDGVLAVEVDGEAFGRARPRRDPRRARGAGGRPAHEHAAGHHAGARRGRARGSDRHGAPARAERRAPARRQTRRRDGRDEHREGDVLRRARVDAGRRS